MMRGISLLIYLLLLSVNSCVCIEMHALQVRILAYENDENEVLRGDQYGCCDGPTISDPCEPCDTSFQYCLRVINPNRQFSINCPTNGRTLFSEVNTDDRPLDFNMSTVLGLSNPFLLGGFQDPEDFELLIVVADFDSEFTFELIDVFKISLAGLTQGQTVEYVKEGNLGIVELRLQLTLTCVVGFTGGLCDTVEQPTTTPMTMEPVTTTTMTTTEPATTKAITTEPMTTKAMTTKLPTTVGATTTAPPTTELTTMEPKITTTMTTERATTTAIETDPAFSKASTMEPATMKTTKTQTTTAKTTTFKNPSTPSTDNATAPLTPREKCAANCSEHGVCVPHNFSCVCQPGFTGSDCTVEMTQMVSEKKTDDVGEIAGGTVGGLVVVIVTTAIILAVIITLILKRKRRKLHVNEQITAAEIERQPPTIIANGDEDYGMIKNIIYGMRLDTGQGHEIVEHIYDNYDQVREESHIYEDVPERFDHFEMNVNVVYANQRTEETFQY